MPLVPINMPQLGESIAEATVINFLVKPGDTVAAHQDVLEVETNKASMTVTSPCPGRIAEWRIKQNESYPVGTILGHIEASAEDAARVGVNGGNGPSKEKARADSEEDHDHHHEHDKGPAKVVPTVRGLPVPAPASGVSYMSPRMKARMMELGLNAADLSGIAGSGAGGRVTIGDFEKYLANLEKQKLSNASPMRVAVADAMRRSWSRPLATVGMPARVDAILNHRKQFTPKPGPALYVLRALSIALAENSAVAGRLVGAKIVHPPAIDIGVAVEAEDGVLVPVIRHADKKSLKELMPVYAQLIEASRQRKVPVEAIGGSIATITNYGTFGLIWATPIPLPEQTLVLGLGAGRKMPCWDEAKQQFYPVTESYLTLSFDHRVLDGGAAGRLLQRIADLMSKPESL